MSIKIEQNFTAPKAIRGGSTGMLLASIASGRWLDADIAVHEIMPRKRHRKPLLHRAAAHILRKSGNLPLSPELRHDFNIPASSSFDPAMPLAPSNTAQEHKRIGDVLDIDPQPRNNTL